MTEAYVMRLRGWRKWSAIAGCGLLTIAFAGFAVGAWLYGGEAGQSDAVVGLAGTALFAPLLLYGIVIARKYRVVFYDDAIEIFMTFQTARMNKVDVKGWTYGHNDGLWAAVIVLHPRDASMRPVTVPLASVNEQPALDWFDGFVNLDDVAAAEGFEQLLSKDRYGATQEERSRALAREHRIARALHWAGIGVSIWIIAWPRPYDLALGIGVALPAVAFILAATLKDRWNYGFFAPFDQRPATAGFYYLAPLAVGARIFDNEILDHLKLIEWAIGLTVCIVAACGLIRALPRNRFEQAVFVLWALVYAYGAAAHANVRLDRSQPETISVQVEEKRESDRNFYLTLAAWAPRTEAKEVAVSRRLYEQASPAKEVQVQVYDGLLGARWFTVQPGGPVEAR